jgi:hypothetical protein
LIYLESSNKTTIGWTIMNERKQALRFLDICLILAVIISILLLRKSSICYGKVTIESLVGLNSIAG